MEDTAALDKLNSYITRIENLLEEKKDIQDGIKFIFTEAKSNGFDPKIMKLVIKIRSMDNGEFEEQQALLDTYMNALTGNHDNH